MVIAFKKKKALVQVYSSSTLLNQGEFPEDKPIQASLLMHHTRLKLGEALTELVLVSLHEISETL